jgi:hypothetical protein
LAKKRKSVPDQIVRQVLTEAGYKCGNPVCRNILAIDIHHMVEVSKGGGNTLANLLALCSYCHDLYHRGTIHRESIYAWKLVLVSLSRAFDTGAVDDLLFLKAPHSSQLLVSGDGVLKFSRLIGGGMAQFRLRMQNGPLVLYEVELTARGGQLIDAWKSGNREAVRNALTAARIEETPGAETGS